MLTGDQISKAKTINIASLASQHTELFGRSRPKGICPFCGGKDFNIDTVSNIWHCNDCTPRGDDAIGFVRKTEGLDFRAAVKRLADGIAAGDPVFSPHKALPSASLPENIRQQVAMNRSRLEHPIDGAKARAYLNSRGLFPELLAGFNMGYYAAVESITLPWYDSTGDVVAVRFRNIGLGPGRYRAQKGSRMVNSVFGTQALRGFDNLVIVEGEINALMLYQIGADFDVVSIGGESSNVPLWLMNEYRRVFVWCDKEERAMEKARAVGAYRVYWGDEDANELCRFWPKVAFDELPYHKQARIITRGEE